MDAIIQWCLNHLNYWVVTLLMILENSLVPLPSELIITPAAYRAAQGELNVYLLIFCTTFGAVVGALINYLLAIKVGRYLIYKFADGRWGKLLGLSEAKLLTVEKYFIKRGKISTFLGRLVPAVRQFISIPAGLARMKLSSFLIYTALGSALWNCILIGLGYYLAYIVPEDKLMEQLSTHSSIIAFSIVGLIIVVWAVKKLIRKLFKKKVKQM
ncbi:DedA family protein [Bacteroides coprosuis]|uniref:DedA family protein n=1 Tax=Bacteroides coprosuis TaxID=151276 RepID=UPI001D7076C9|nr:DedA family protein [Bacteroides coprosuis]HJD91968.1 DedA family protein [Bacteroides coprosuis]